MEDKSCKNCHFISYKRELGSITFNKLVREEHKERWLCGLMRDSNYNQEYLKYFEPCELWESR